MSRRLLLIAAVGIFLAAGVWAVALPPRLTCASLGYPEGTGCREGRIDFEDHGRFVSVHVERRLPLRLGILGIGTAPAVGLLLLSDRASTRRE
jgi:hypothetical protein